MSSIKSQSGNTILMMLVMIAGLSLATIAMFGNSQVYDTSGKRFVARERALYVSDGTRAFATQLTQDYLKQKPDATNDEVASYLGGALPPLLPEGYSVDNINVSITPEGTLIIPNGVFKGMVAPQVYAKFDYTISRGDANSENRLSHHFEAIVSLAQVGLHQFMYFIDLEAAGFNPGPITKVDGRVHANGDFCIAGGNGLTMLKVSAAGRLMHSRRTECGVNSMMYPLTKTFIASTSDITGTTKMFGINVTPTTGNDNGCTNCQGTGLNWPDYSLQNWNGNVQDVAQHVPRLTLPVPTDIKAQVGANGANPYIGYANTKNLRFLVDPVRTADSDNVKKMKYAYNADIRIIDGVWYLRNRTTNTWPGTPIWSDHPGNFTDPFGNAVGQDDLRTTRSWGLVTPKKFSYYDYVPLTHSLSGLASGTISYGNLARVTGGTFPSWYPGQLLDQTHNFATPGYYSGASNLCPVPDPTTNLYVAVSPTVSGRTVRVWNSATPQTCALGGAAPTFATALLNATRSGFNDPHVAWYWKNFNTTYPHVTTTPNDHSHILPVNFDVDHFQTALNDSVNVGELGTYFTHNGSATDFNGIIYITTTWPGSDDGYDPRGAPSNWPLQNDGGFPSDNPTAAISVPGDTLQIRLTSWEQQRDLPYQLCTSASTLAGQGFDQNLSGKHFSVPNCDSYTRGTGPLKAYPNAIRIHNGWNLSTTTFPKGLSIVSNMPVYVLGTYNHNSNVTSGTATPWIPALIAGDQISVMSDGWDDANAPFAIYEKGEAIQRHALDTSYTVSLVSGFAMHQPSSGVVPQATNEATHSMPALMEDWSWTTPAKTMTLTGSITLGYYPVYYRGGRYYWPRTSSFDPFNQTAASLSTYNYATYVAGSKSIIYDKHLELINSQPPGSPVFYTSSMLSWKIK